MKGLSAPQHRLEAAHHRAPRSSVPASGFLTAEDADTVTQFYLGFDAEARRLRFGNAASDAEIVDYCGWINWRRSVLIAHGNARALDAVLEIHPLSQQWDCAELIAACPCAGDRNHIFAELLEIAALAARQRGCRTFLVPMNDTAREMLPLLQDMGRVRIATTQACVDLSGIAVERERTQSAPIPWSTMPAGLQAGAQFG
jgi:hypothetical protein